MAGSTASAAAEAGAGAKPRGLGLAVETTALEKRFGGRVAVHGLDLRVERGSVFGLIGPNGAGKTTTLRMLVDVLRPSAGKVRVLGGDPKRAGPALRARIGFIPGELRLDGRTTAGRMLEFYARVSGPVQPGRVDALAERLGLDLARPVRTLSKGNKQKIGIVQAFMHDPELLILDEPTSGLDPLVQREFLHLVREARDAGRTVLLSSHVLSEIQQTADAVAVLSEGRIVAEGDVASLRLSAVRRVHAGLLGADERSLRAELSGLPNLHDVAFDASTARDSIRVSATVEGDIDGLVKLLAAHTVADLAVEEPDLEESVLRLYGAQSQRDSHRERPRGASRGANRRGSHGGRHV